MKRRHRLLNIMLAAVALLIFSAPVHASKMDSRTVSTARHSYIFKTFLHDDDIKIDSKDGIVTMYGKAGGVAEKDLAGKFAGDVNGVKIVNNRMTIE